MPKPYYLRDNEKECQCVSMGLEEEHDERYECRKCSKCCADECCLAESNDTYEDKGICLPCFMEENPQVTIEEIATIIGKTY